MHGQRNYTTQVGQDPYARPPPFQQHPPASTTSTSHYGPFAPQPQGHQQRHPSFHSTPGFAAYQHAPNVPHQGLHAPVVSGGLSSAQSYFPHPRPPHTNTQISHSYPSSEQNSLPWSRNVHQLPPAPPLTGPIAYQLPSSQGHTLERGPSFQPPSHVPPPSLPPYSSSSSALMSDPFGSSVLPMREHSNKKSMVPVLPPPPPPPPPPSSPPGVPPIPPSSSPSEIISRRNGGGSLKGLEGSNLMMECPNPVEDISVHDADVSFHQAEKSGTKVGPTDAVVADSPDDSDMDMEDDITHPDEDKKNDLSINSYDEHVLKSQVNEQLQPLQHAGQHDLPDNAEYENSLFAKASVLEAERGGFGIASDCNFSFTAKVTSEADDSGVSEKEQNEHPLEFSAEDSSQHKNLRQPSAPVVSEENDCGNLLDQAMEGAGPFKLLQGYASDNTSENEEDNLLTNAGSHSANDGSMIFGAEGCDFGSELRHKTVTESSKHIMVESPRNMMQADKLSVPTRIVEEITDRGHRGEESVSIHYVTHPLKDSRSYDDSTGPEGANLHKQNIKSNSSKVNVDEFGRLVREGVSDSDTSGSPHYARRHSRRTRKRSRSRSRSRSPHDRRRRRRRRSPRKKKERHSRSRSLSPKRRRSRSRSPVSWRDSELSGDKFSRDKGQIPECFDFIRGKCYRGASCRYSHRESNKSERSRYNRGKQHYRDAPPSLRSPDVYEDSKAIPDKKMKDKGLGLVEDMRGSRDTKDVERPPVDSSTNPPSINQSLFTESAAPYSDEIPQIVYQQGQTTDDAPVSEFPIPAQTIAASSTPQGADKSDGEQGTTSQLSSVDRHITNPYSTGEVPPQSLKEPPSVANHSPELTGPVPSVSQALSAPFSQPITQDYNSKPSLLWNHMIPGNNLPYQAPVAYQHFHFPGQSRSSSNSFLPLPPPPPLPPLQPPTGEHSISSQQMQQPLLPPWNGLSGYTSTRAQLTELPYKSQTDQYQVYPLSQEPDQMLHTAGSYGSSSLHASNLTSRLGGPHIVGEDRPSGHPVQGMNPSVQPLPNSLSIQSPLKGMHNSAAGGVPADNISHSRPYFQQASYGLQYVGAVTPPAQHSEPGLVISSASRITPDFLERNRPSYVRDFTESRMPNYFNPYGPTFDVPPSSKFSPNALIQESDTTINTKYGAPVGLSTATVDAHKTGSVGSKNLPISPRPHGDQYDPYFDSFEPASNSFSKSDHKKHETTGDSDDVLRFSGSGRVLSMEGIKQEGGTAASVNDSLEMEECGETADVELDAVLDGTSSNPNDVTDTNGGEIEIDQIKSSGKKKKSKERSTKHFKVSIATFVKEVLKPSWRQGNMSKEAFKTIVKKTVDKVSGAMKSHQIPKSQAKINHYIDSSRGKLTKLVMGYVDKYVKA